jgi:hypothetical protein
MFSTPVVAVGRLLLGAAALLLLSFNSSAHRGHAVWTDITWSGSGFEIVHRMHLSDAITASRYMGGGLPIDDLRSLALVALYVEERFLLYSLRRGGATADFLVHGDAARCMLRGRWKDVRTFSIYLRTPEALRMSESFAATPEVAERASRFSKQPYM